MAFKVLLKRFKAFKIKKVTVRKIKIKNTNNTDSERIWTGVSHGFHAVERDVETDGFVHAQREQVEGHEFWLFGAFDQQMGPGITKYLQSRLFDNNLNENQIRRKAKATMKKAYASTKIKIQAQKENNSRGSSSVLVMKGERFVSASIGGYRAILCRDGLGTQLGLKHQRKVRRKWAVSDIWNMKCTSTNGENNPNKSSKLAISSKKVEAETEFIILASDGVWQVMRNQEAVDLIAHIEDAQKAAECLAEEALNRMSKSAIQCIVIRFH
ncbi:uncharacterized protein A4U43_C01F18670 [Asparagus officinalis]|uniref:protein-serine/threonine phosphatase n=1 Tax=Asparagus officinalis TaxID=4686 RepID=A0A5P1FSW1_ASPOF|nr:putative protein phosphatase 2C-like protein 44 [Asparagus officinalis]ONK80517.1 uncharacterized protein A4U43_C01F18670 [Asparagus officinalis]